MPGNKEKFLRERWPQRGTAGRTGYHLQVLLLFHGGHFFIIERMNRLQKRAPWALTLYFGFLLFLLLWGRIESAPLYHSGTGGPLWQDAHQACTVLKSATSCPACDRQGAGGLPFAGAGAVLTPAKSDAQNPAPAASRPQPLPMVVVADPGLSRIPPSPGIHPPLNSLRTVVLLN